MLSSYCLQIGTLRLCRERSQPHQPVQFGHCMAMGQLLDPGMPPPPGAGGTLGLGAVPVAAFLGRKGKSREEREGGRDRGRQLATAVLKTSSMLLGGIEGEKNQTLHKTEQPKLQNTAPREVVGTVLHVLPGSGAWLPAGRKETRNYRVY